MSSNKGSEWRKWDLHVHTPASFFLERGQAAETNDRSREGGIDKGFYKSSQ